MVSLRFDIRDIFRSARLAFSFQRLWIQSTGLFVGYLGYLIFTYAGFLIAGRGFGAIWSRFGLFPCAFGLNLPFLSWLVFYAGIFFLLALCLITSTAVSRAVYMYLKGFHFYTWKDAFKFAFRKKGSVLFTPISILLIIVLTGLGGAFIGWFSKIIYPVGPITLSLFTILWYGVSFFLLFLVLALIVSLFLSPSIIATTDDDAFEGIFQSFSTMYSQPWRFLLYEILLLIVMLLSFGLLAFFAKQAWLIMNWIFAWGMGVKYVDLSFGAAYLLQNWLYPAVLWSKEILGEFSSIIFFARDFVPLHLSLPLNIASTIFAIFLVFIGGFIFSYPLAIFNAGNCLIFLALKNRKDDENLLKRKDKEEEDEEDEVPEIDEVKKEEVKKKKDTVKKKKEAVKKKKEK
jgi:hypothetical protein